MKRYFVMNAGSVLAFLMVFVSGHAAADNGFFMGGSLGRATVSDKIPSNQQVQDIDFRSSDTAYKIYAGFKLSNLAIETGYVDFGKPTDAGANLALTGLDAFGILHFALGPVSVFGKLGLVRWDYDLDHIVSNYHKEGTDAAFGVGARFDLGSLGLRIEYELFDVGEVNDLYLFSVGATYTFF